MHFGSKLDLIRRMTSRPGGAGPQTSISRFSSGGQRSTTQPPARWETGAVMVSTNCLSIDEPSPDHQRLRTVPIPRSATTPCCPLVSSRAARRRFACGTCAGNRLNLMDRSGGGGPTHDRSIKGCHTEPASCCNRSTVLSVPTASRARRAESERSDTAAGTALEQGQQRVSLAFQTDPFPHQGVDQNQSGGTSARGLHRGGGGKNGVKVRRCNKKCLIQRWPGRQLECGLHYDS